MSEASNETAILQAFESIRRAQRDGVYAPHKPLLLLLALARVQQGESRLVEFSELDSQLKALLTEFGPSSAPGSRHYPFWHLATDQGGRIWTLDGPAEILSRPPAQTPTLGELRQHHIKGGFSAEVDRELRSNPRLVVTLARRVLESFFPNTLHQDIAGAIGLDLDEPVLDDSKYATETVTRRRRNREFRERVLLAYEYRCCVCGFDLRIGNQPAGLEAAHIRWHHAGGPDTEPNGLSLCALHHKLFDLGAFTIEPEEHRVVFSRHAIVRGPSTETELRHHGQKMLRPQEDHLVPQREFLDWNWRLVFKRPEREHSFAARMYNHVNDH